MEGERQAESKKDSSNNLPSEPGEAIKAFEKNLEGLENLVKLLKSDVNKPLDISDSISSDSEVEIEEATKLKEYLSQPCKLIIAKRLGLKIDPISEVSSEELLSHKLCDK